ncbi:hypothetical protein LCGC14_3058350, partial [marine sediment metagenome]
KGRPVQAADPVIPNLQGLQSLHRQHRQVQIRIAQRLPRHRFQTHRKPLQLRIMG